MSDRTKLVAAVALWNFAGVAVIPSRVTWFYPPLVRSPAGVALHLCWRVSYAVAVRQWLIPTFAAIVENRRRAESELTTRLGRTPTEEELLEELELRSA